MSDRESEYWRKFTGKEDSGKKWTVTKVEAFDCKNWVHRQTAVQVGDVLRISVLEPGEAKKQADPRSQTETIDRAALTAALAAKEPGTRLPAAAASGCQRKFVVENGMRDTRWNVLYSDEQRELWENIQLPTRDAMDRVVGEEVSADHLDDIAHELLEARGPELDAASLPQGSAVEDWKTLLNKSAYLQDKSERGLREIGVLNIKYLGKQASGRDHIIGIIVNRFNHAGCEWHAEA